MLGLSLGPADRAVVQGALTAAPPALPIVRLSAAVSQAEGDSATIAYSYAVTRSSTAGAVAVPWAFAAGGTSAGDFTGGTLPTGGTVDMADGVATGSITIAVAGDVAVEADESFTVSIAAPAGYALGTPSSATGTILNDDAGAASTYLTDDAGNRLTDDAGNRLVLEFA